MIGISSLVYSHKINQKVKQDYQEQELKRSLKNELITIRQTLNALENEKLPDYQLLLYIQNSSDSISEIAEILGKQCPFPDLLKSAVKLDLNDDKSKSAYRKALKDFVEVVSKLLK